MRRHKHTAYKLHTPSSVMRSARKHFLHEEAEGMDPFEHEDNIMTQSVLIPKYFGIDEARRWVHDHGYKTSYYGKDVDVTKNFFRFRQEKPVHGAEYFTETLPNGVELVMYKL